MCIIGESDELRACSENDVTLQCKSKAMHHMINFYTTAHLIVLVVEKQNQNYHTKMLVMSSALLWKHDEIFQLGIAAAIGKSTPKRPTMKTTLLFVLFMSLCICQHTYIVHYPLAPYPHQ